MKAGKGGDDNDTLEKSLTLFDVYAMATGAMFSSGLFLLPGIAAATTGNSVYLAYLAAGILMLPAMYCMAELSTAMPKAGGTYFFLDRSMGPMMGAIGGLGSWIAVVFKSAFALVGMGAYLGIYLDVPITLTAVILTLVFGMINYVGAKETTMLQRVLVTILVVILAVFVLAGLVEVGVPELLRPASGYDVLHGRGGRLSVDDRACLRVLCRADQGGERGRRGPEPRPQHSAGHAFVADHGDRDLYAGNTDPGQGSRARRALRQPDARCRRCAGFPGLGSL